MVEVLFLFCYLMLNIFVIVRCTARFGTPQWWLANELTQFLLRSSRVDLIRLVYQ